MSQSLKSTYENREQEIGSSQKTLQSELRKLIENQVPNAESILRLQENMNTIYATMNREIRFLQLMVEAVALNNIDQPEPERIDPKTTLTGEHKKILDWLVKYMQHKPGEML